jgi:hypothetical protein
MALFANQFRQPCFCCGAPRLSRAQVIASPDKSFQEFGNEVRHGVTSLMRVVIANFDEEGFISKAEQGQKPLRDYTYVCKLQGKER